MTKATDDDTEVDPTEIGDQFRAPPLETALITGGSRGLGLALGRALADRGTKVVLVARQAGPLNAAVAELCAAGRQAHAIVADVADLEGATAVAGQAAALVGPIDLLVNNASTLGAVPLRLLLDTDCEDLSRTLEVNLLAPFRLTKVIAGSQVLRPRGGTILNITSDAGVEAYPRWGGYGVSKAALEHLGRIWAAEMAGTAVRVLTVDPGEMDTRMHAEAMPDTDPNTLAAPARVAAEIVRLLTSLPPPPSGSRTAIGAAVQTGQETGQKTRGDRP
ncbi:MAG: SDR family oxidoreductase [Polyangia bacterium]